MSSDGSDYAGRTFALELAVELRKHGADIVDRTADSVVDDARIFESYLRTGPDEPLETGEEPAS
jgi:hypothetical protein